MMRGFLPSCLQGSVETLLRLVRLGLLWSKAIQIVVRADCPPSRGQGRRRRRLSLTALPCQSNWTLLVCTQTHSHLGLTRLVDHSVITIRPLSVWYTGLTWCVLDFQRGSIVYFESQYSYWISVNSIYCSSDLRWKFKKNMDKISHCDATFPTKMSTLKLPVKARFNMLDFKINQKCFDIQAF